MHYLSPFFYMEAKFRSLYKRIKNDWHQSRWNFSEEQRDAHFDHKRTEVILEEFKVESVEEKPRRYESSWLRRVKIMNSNNRMTKTMLKYRPNGRRRIWRPLKRLLDEAGAGLLRLNWWGIIIIIIIIIIACVLIMGFVVDKVALVQIFFLWGLPFYSIFTFPPVLHIRITVSSKFYHCNVV